MTPIEQLAKFSAADNRIAALVSGIVDGIEQGDAFDCGLTFPDPALNELYDTGVNAGQAVGRHGPPEPKLVGIWVAACNRQCELIRWGLDGDTELPFPATDEAEALAQAEYIDKSPLHANDSVYLLYIFDNGQMRQDHYTGEAELERETTPAPALTGTQKTYRSSATTKGAPGYPERNGQTVEVLRPLTTDEADEEVGPMFRIRFLDGTETDAFADELT